MKGLKFKEHIRNTTAIPLGKIKETDKIRLTYLDMAPIEFNRENVMNWLTGSGWIEGLIIKKLGDNCPYLDDYIQEIFLMIFEKIDKLIDVYETRGILAFCGYIKIIIQVNCTTKTCLAYKHIRQYNEVIKGYDIEVLNDIYDQYDPELDFFYKFTKTNDIY